MPPKRKAAPALEHRSRAAPQSSLKKIAAEYRKQLNSRLAQIKSQYLVRANEVKQRAKDKIQEKKTRIFAQQTRERRQVSVKLLKLLNARDAKLQAIASKLEETKHDHDTFAACLSVVYKTLSDKASNLSDITPTPRHTANSKDRARR
ncbi:hypothetical protein GGTG_05814 [Gaeumannomyces tritici R3-111a-1]|uniref:Uncharacterized protein n=1 Tax=Gaeumannomyces tritici (strain R3-111a-1) TaxID=644352 RepID=J3NX04_GAET3|nr:hypothetical protein GGTG_05814 [Gaeumannomyces tritici R3-111a-1]EJT75886.1 hypothetical protein GGTG_05814 [Gaeumannomyces tritici R3-111a-1]